MDKELNLRVDGLADGADLLQGQLPFQHQAAESQAFQPLCLLRRTDGALGGSMHHQCVAHAQHGRVLDDECVHPGLLQLPHQRTGLRNLLLLQQGVHRGINAHPKAVSIGAQRPDVLHAVSGRLPGPERRAGNVHGIRPAVYGRDANLCRPCRRQQFQGNHTANKPGVNRAFGAMGF